MSEDKQARIGIGIALGAGVGAAIGVAIRVGTGAVIGIAVAVALGGRNGDTS